MATALITAADHPTGLGTARALAEVDVRLIGLCTNPASRFCRSRLWNRLIVVPGDIEAYLEKLVDIGRSAAERIVLFPSQDELVLLLSNNREELEKYYDFVLPERATVDLLMDKTAFHRWAEAHQFPVPESHVVESQTELNHVLKHIEYPIAIKPLFRTSDWQIKSPVDKILKLASRAELHDIRFDLFDCAPRFLIQRWIEGGDSGVHFCLVYVDRTGRELDYYTGRKLLQWPRLTGSTAIGVGTDDGELHDLTKKVMAAANFIGLGSVEVKKSKTDDRYYITEPTVGRNNMQSYIAVAGGVNLTLAAFDDASASHHHWDPKRRRAVWIEEYSLLQAFLHGLKQRELGLMAILRQMHGTISLGSFSLRDPMPLLLLGRDIVRGQLRRWSKRLTAQRAHEPRDD
jgi:D-aspartate ligase